MFKKLEGDSVLLRQGGVYKPCEVYTFQGGLYAKFGGGYIRMRRDGTTSKDGVMMEHMEYEGDLFCDQFGRLTHTKKPGYKRLGLTSGDTLLITET